MTRNTPFRAGKGTLYEGGVRSAAFVTWPNRIPAGQRIDEPVHIIDWFPTFVEAAGGSLTQPLPLDGKSLLPTLTAGQPSPHKSLLLVQSPTRAAVRAGDWKLLRLAGPPTETAAEETDTGAPAAAKGKGKAKGRKNNDTAEVLQLYNLRQDPGESQNMATSQPAKVRELQQFLDQWMQNAAPSGVPAK